ncbi:hypothetical protein C0Q70_01944 [Pomacea canaliculata]|uniref:Uncharacterized protein n=1 Tax=Pomacea canaliculata TaxID=400727 RepID=A0A2T7Q0W2_POMCA|nr:uncharacterized protein LOC112566025 [Pomacea canaliculata]PVD39315.1 hypothetical protein C0Q70_01944 [Pomacea canaliculata]
MAVSQPPTQVHRASEVSLQEGKTVYGQAAGMPEDSQDPIEQELRQLLLQEMKRRDQFRHHLRTFLAEHLQPTEDFLMTLMDPDDSLSLLLQRCVEIIGVKKRDKDSPKLRQEVDSGIANSMTENRDSSFVLMRTPFTGTRPHTANRRQAGIFPSEFWRHDVTIAVSPEFSTGTSSNLPVEHSELSS